MDANLLAKRDEGIFLAYSTNSRTYSVFNSITKVIMKFINVVIDDSQTDGVVDVEEDVETSTPQTEISDVDPETEAHEAEPEPAPASKGPSVRVQKNHPKNLIIGNPEQRITTRRSNDVIINSCFVSFIEPKNFKEALTDECWIEVMQEELN
jgi:FtsZ-interacting cell division protein YlmF